MDEKQVPRWKGSEMTAIVAIETVAVALDDRHHTNLNGKQRDKISNGLFLSFSEVIGSQTFK